MSVVVFYLALRWVLRCVFSLEQVSVEPRPSALNMTLPAFAAERRRLRQISINSWYTRPQGIQQSAPNQPHAAAAVDRRDRQTDRPCWASVITAAVSEWVWCVEDGSGCATAWYFVARTSCCTSKATMSTHSRATISAACATRGARSRPTRRW